MKTRYKLHWNSNTPIKNLKWAIWDWILYRPIIYIETRKMGREICNMLNAKKIK